MYTVHNKLHKQVVLCLQQYLFSFLVHLDCSLIVGTAVVCTMATSCTSVWPSASCLHYLTWFHIIRCHTYYITNAKGSQSALTEHLDHNPDKYVRQGKGGYADSWVEGERDDSAFVAEKKTNTDSNHRSPHRIQIHIPPHEPQEGVKSSTRDDYIILLNLSLTD